MFQRRLQGIVLKGSGVMIKIAVYGKGGIGKSTTVANIAAALADSGLKIMQIGCDPKADSTVLLRGKEKMTTILDLVKEKGNDFELSEMVRKGYNGIICAEAGGPAPGTGCAGRGIIAALEKLSEKGAYDTFKPDVILFDVLGDVVCGGFTMPMRPGYADYVFVVTSGENMAIYAAANIATAVNNFKSRGYAKFGGIILNKRNVKNELEKVQELAEDFESEIIGTLSRSELVQDSEEVGKTVVEAFPDSSMATEYRILAENIINKCKGDTNDC